MSNKANHRRRHGHIRRKNPHSPGRKVAGCSCGRSAHVARRASVEQIEKRDLQAWLAQTRSAAA